MLKDDTMNASTDSKGSSHYLIFKLGEELFGCPLLQVQEVVGLPQIKPLPQYIEHLKGIANLRGHVLSVMDLRERLGFEKTEGERPLMFVVLAQGIRLGVIADSAESVIEIPNQDIESPLSINPKIPNDHYIGVAKVGVSLIHLLDIEKLTLEAVSNKQKSVETRE